MHCKKMQLRTGDYKDQQLHNKHNHFKKWLLQFGHIKNGNDSGAI